MDKNVLRRLNKRLADELGSNLFGEPIYKWARTEDLTYPYRTTDNFFQPQGQVWMPQAETRHEMITPHLRGRWALAKWVSPEMYKIWAEGCGNQANIPMRGLYWVSDIILKSGLEPNEELTSECISKVKIFRRLDKQQILDHQQGAIRRSERAEQSYVDALVDERMPAFNNVPGKRGGHVSYGGV